MCLLLASPGEGDGKEQGCLGGLHLYISGFKMPINIFVKKLLLETQKQLCFISDWSICEDMARKGQK